MKFSELPFVNMIHPEGHRWVIGFGVATIIFFLIGWSWLWVPTLILTIFCGSFFRDPERFPPLKEGSVVSPADGRVLSVTEVEGPELAGIEKSTKVSIFMSIFNVHVNRSPAGNAPGREKMIRKKSSESESAPRASSSQSDKK